MPATPIELFNVANAASGTDGAMLVGRGPGTVPLLDPNNYWHSTNRQRKLVGHAVGSGGHRWNLQDDEGTDLHSVDKFGTFAGRATGAPVVLSATVSSVSLTSNTATINTTAAHGFRPSDLAVVDDLATSDLNGSWVVVTTPTPTSFTFYLEHANIASTPDSGSAVVTRSACIHEFCDTAGTPRNWIDKRGGMTFAKDLPGAPTRFGDDASISICQTQNGILGDDVAIAIYDVNYRWTATADNPKLWLQTYILADGTYFSGRALIISQDRSKPSGRIAMLGGQCMVGISSDINGPCLIVQNQLDIPGDNYRYSIVFLDAADTNPLYPAGGIWSDRGVGKAVGVMGPRMEMLWGNYLNPNGDNSNPELWRLAKLYLHRTTNHLTIEGSGQTATTTYCDLYGPPGGNSILQWGSRGTQNAFWIGTSASTTGSANFNLASQTILRFYNNPIGDAGAAAAIGVDDSGSVLTVDSAPSNIGAPVLTIRGKNGQTGLLLRAQDYLQNTFLCITPGQSLVVGTNATGSAAARLEVRAKDASSPMLAGYTSSGGTPPFVVDALGNLRVKQAQTYATSLTCPTTVGNASEFGYLDISATDGSGSFDVTLNINGAGYAQSKKYMISTVWAASSTWREVQPIESSGPYSGNDCELDVMQTTANLQFRVRRTAGSTAATAALAVVGTVTSFAPFTVTGTTGSVTPPTTKFLADRTGGTSGNFVAGALFMGRKSVTGATVLTNADPAFIALTTISAPYTVTLPAANSVPAGRPIVVKDESGTAGANTVTLAPAGSDTGETTFTIASNGASLKVYSNGVSKWFLQP